MSAFNFKGMSDIIVSMHENAKKPVILIFTTAYDPFIGGAEIAIKEIVFRVKSEFDFFILTSRFDKKLPIKDEKDGVTIIRLGFGKPWDKFMLPVSALFSGAYFLIKYRQSSRVLWSVMASYGSIAASILKIFFPRVPYILTLQEGDSEEHIKKTRLGLVSLLGFRFAFSKCDFVTAISNYLLDLSRRFNYKGRGEVIPNGVDINNFKRRFLRADTDELISQLGLAGDEKIIITTSRLVKKNAIDIVIRGLSVLKAAGHGLAVKFLILGSGQEARPLKELAKRLGVLDDVLFVGSVSHDELPKYLAIADVFVRPSRSEGLGNSFIEAMASGVPIIGTPVGGIPDFLIDGKTGYLSKVDDPDDLAEKILKVLSADKSDLSKIIVSAKKTAEKKYLWENIANRFSYIFKKEISRSHKPRILIAAGIFPPDIGGPATYAKTIAEEFSRKNYRVRVVLYSDGESLSGEVNDYYYRTYGVSRKKPKGLRHMIYFFTCLVHGLTSDIVYAQDPVSAGIPALAAAEILRKRFLVKITGDYAWEQAVGRFGVLDTIEAFQIRGYRFRIEFLRFLQAFSARHAESVVVPSVFLKNLVRGWMIDEKKISVIHNSADDEFLANVENVRESAGLRESVRSSLGIENGGQLILSVGRLVKWKGFEMLIDVFRDLSAKHPELKLMIIGRGPEKERIISLISGSAARQKIFLMDRVPHAKLAEYLVASDVFVLNSSYEGFSHQIVEAMACGVPVIAANAGGNPEIIEDGVNGILINYGDKPALGKAVESLMRDPGLSRKISENGRKTAGFYSKKRMIDELEKLILKKFVQNSKAGF